MKLTAAKAARPGKHHDGHGLFLVVTKAGAKRWTQRYTVDGRRREAGLGKFPDLSLAEARKMGAQVRTAVATGGDPIAERQRAKAPTFREAAEKVFDLNRRQWTPRHQKWWWSSMETNVFPMIGHIPVDQIRRADVLAVVEPIWAVKHETARKVRGRIRAVLGWATAHEYLEFNPAGDAIDGALPKSPVPVRHHPSLPYDELAEAVDVVRDTEADPSSKLLFRFIVLTGVRFGDANKATWDEVDMEEAVWSIPADRMKARKPHRVPLSRQALEVLDQAKALYDGSGWVFPSPLRPGHPLSNNTLLKLLKTTGLYPRTDVHGFRSSFRTWALEQTDTPWAVAQAALAHSLGGSVEQAYIRSDLFDRRRRLMDEWADYISS